MAGTSNDAAGSGWASYGRVAKILHWLIAAAFALQVGLGWRMDGPIGPQTFAIFQLHKSVGITILLLTLVRLAWRIGHPVAPLAGLSRAERVAAEVVHWGFYFLLIGLPLTGWLLVSSSPRDVPTILYHTVPWPHVPGVAHLAAPAKAAVNGASVFAHHALAYVAYLAIALHLAGALKHQFFDHADTPLRMLGARRGRLGFVVAVVFVAAALIVGQSIYRGGRAARDVSAPQREAVRPAPPARAALPAPPASSPAPAATPTPTSVAEPAPDAATARPVEWIVRKTSSSLKFENNWSQGTVDGSFARWDTKILFSPDALADSSVTATIDLSSVTTNSATVTQALPGDDWFGVAAHPTATFSGKAFRHLGGNRYDVSGTLDLHGVKRPLRLPFTLSIAGRVATMAGSITIDRTTFGVGQGEWASIDDVPAAVTISIAIKADQRP